MGLPSSRRDAFKCYAFLGIVVILAALLMSCGSPEPTPASVVGSTSDTPTSPSPIPAAVAAGAAEQAAGGSPTPTAAQATGTTAPETVAAPTPAPTPVPAPLPTAMPAAQPGPGPSPATQPMPTAAPAKQPTPTPLPPPTVTPTPTAVPPPQLTGRVDLEAVRPLFAKRGLSLDLGLERVSIHSLDGVVLASQTELEPDAKFSFVASRKNAYLIMAQTPGGLKLWAISPLVLKDTVQIVNLRSTYEAGLIFASLGTSPPVSAKVDGLKLQANQALDQDVDRLVKTVERVIDNVILKRIDYSPITEASSTNLRAFGGGLEPVRSLDAVLQSPEADFFAYIYATQMTDSGNRIVMTEIKAKRWDYRVAGAGSNSAHA